MGQMYGLREFDPDYLDTDIPEQLTNPGMRWSQVPREAVCFRLQEEMAVHAHLRVRADHSGATETDWTIMDDHWRNVVEPLKAERDRLASAGGLAQPSTVYGR